MAGNLMFRNVAGATRAYYGTGPVVADFNRPHVTPDGPFEWFTITLTMDNGTERVVTGLAPRGEGKDLATNWAANMWGHVYES